MIEIKISESLTPDLGELLWTEFFQSRGRGISLIKHFPWIGNQKEATFFAAEKSGMLVGGLVLRNQVCTINGESLKYGVIGLVTVNPEQRGQGIAKQILDQAILYAKQCDFEFLTLWTSKHEVYARHGFEISDKWNYGWVRRKSRSVCDFKNESLCQSILIESDKLPLPPFANAVYEIRVSSECSVAVVSDRVGFVVAGYKGDYIEAGMAMLNALPDSWRLNAIDHDPLIGILAEKGMSIELSPANLQMWVSLKKNFSIPDLANAVNFSVLDRI